MISYAFAFQSLIQHLCNPYETLMKQLWNNYESIFITVAPEKEHFLQDQKMSRCGKFHEIYTKSFLYMVILYGALEE